MEEVVGQEDLEYDYIDLTLDDTDDNVANKYANVIDNKLALFLQEIEIMMKLAPKSIWGVATYLDVRRYVFNKFITTSQIKVAVTSYVNKECASSKYFNWNVTCETVNTGGNIGDLIYIQFIIEAGGDQGETHEIVQKFLIGADAKQFGGLGSNTYEIKL